MTARINQSLDALLAELRDLPVLAAEWDTLSDAIRASVALDWDHLLIDLLGELLQFNQRSELSREQHDQLIEVQRLLDDARPLLGRLGFPIPSALPVR